MEGDGPSVTQAIYGLKTKNQHFKLCLETEGSSEQMFQHGLYCPSSQTLTVSLGCCILDQLTFPDHFQRHVKCLVMT